MDREVSLPYVYVQNTRDHGDEPYQGRGGLTHRLVTFASGAPLALFDVETVCTHSRACLAHGLQLGRSLSHCVREFIVREVVCLPLCPLMKDGVFVVLKRQV